MGTPLDEKVTVQGGTLFFPGFSGGSGVVPGRLCHKVTVERGWRKTRLITQGDKVMVELFFNPESCDYDFWTPNLGHPWVRVWIGDQKDVEARISADFDELSEIEQSARLEHWSDQ